MQTEKKKGGRPKKKPSDKRSSRIEIRLSEKEKQEFKHLLDTSVYKSYSDMIRDIVLLRDFKVRTLDPDLREEKSLLITEAKYLGNNFNQFLKQIHSKKLTYFTSSEKDQVLKSIKEIHIILYKIFKSI